MIYHHVVQGLKLCAEYDTLCVIQNVKCATRNEKVCYGLPVVLFNTNFP